MADETPTIPAPTITVLALFINPPEFSGILPNLDHHFKYKDVAYVSFFVIYNDMSLRFRQLQAFHAIIETGTVTGAAAQLEISQPGISNLLNQLERQTRFRLFERVKGRLIATPEANVLYQEVDTVVRGLDHVNQTVLDLQNKQVGQLQVATQHSISFGLMPKLIARFAKDRPDMSISFQS
ncbi:MAG: molybdenum-dependent DNA-binding transcriptional regulator ModE, partial [Paracoccaceae bacterium]